ncbi:hypothetical protein QF027_009100 [Streptomyces canus]|nr:hypothetical protein [Streptomyces canus]
MTASPEYPGHRLRHGRSTCGRWVRRLPAGKARLPAGEGWASRWGQVRLSAVDVPAIGRGQGVRLSAGEAPTFVRWMRRPSARRQVGLLRRMGQRSGRGGADLRLVDASVCGRGQVGCSGVVASASGRGDGSAFGGWAGRSQRWMCRLRPWEALAVGLGQVGLPPRTGQPSEVDASAFRPGGRGRPSTRGCVGLRLGAGRPPAVEWRLPARRQVGFRLVDRSASSVGRVGLRPWKRWPAVRTGRSPVQGTGQPPAVDASAFRPGAGWPSGVDGSASGWGRPRLPDVDALAPGQGLVGVPPRDDTSGFGRGCVDSGQAIPQASAGRGLSRAAPGTSGAAGRGPVQRGPMSGRVPGR